MFNIDWKNFINIIDFAYQPIVDIRNGKTLAFEALIRNFDKNFKDIDELFNTLYDEKILFNIDIELRKKAIAKLRDIYENNSDILLFYNIDNRIIEMENYKIHVTDAILDCFGVHKNYITFEISEKHQFSSFESVATIFEAYKNQGFSIAIDDFGTGFSGLKMLYHFLPDFIKIDRFFIADIVNDAKKKLFVTNIVNIAHQINTKVIAEGIETIDEYIACLEIGCDFAQGYFIQKPTLNVRELKSKYKIPSFKKRGISIDNFNLNSVYYSSSNYNELIDKYIIASATDLEGKITSVSDAFCKLSGYKKYELLGKPHNIVRNPTNSSDIYFNMWDTIKNGKVWHGELSNLAKNGQIYWVESTISPNYSKDGKLVGYTSIRQNITEKKYLEELSITDHLTKLFNRRYFDKQLNLMIDNSVQYNSYLTLALFDIDHFKLYNDTYGHSKGDKVLKKISNCIQSLCEDEEVFCRIGGEEFALIFLDKNQNETKEFLQKCLNAVENLEIEHKNNFNVSNYVTISCGAICSRGHMIYEQYSKLMISADSLLYEAKNGGKNRLVLNCSGNFNCISSNRLLSRVQY